jgi:hypothetical protein
MTRMGGDGDGRDACPTFLRGPRLPRFSGKNGAAFCLIRVGDYFQL